MFGTLGAAAKSNVEDEMVLHPWRIRRYEFLTDSCGAGKWRGGPGIHWEAVNEGLDATVNTGTCDGTTTTVLGVLGGQPSPYNSISFIRGIERIDLKSHRVYTSFPGDILVSKAGGGAGVGNPEERDPEMVREDVIDELVSIQAARDIYKVVLDPSTLAIDYEATNALRSA